MCGIVGAVSRAPVNGRLIEQMRDRLAHRGPDAAGLWSTEDRRVCLAHRRLSIVDLSPEANQPFVSSDGRFVITHNGEIYNFRAIRAELERLGATFRTRSDTEVLVEAYRQWGADCLSRLTGMFAFAIWDTDRGRLFCARDRAGEKPFHYALLDGAFVFASELKSLTMWPAFRREIDYTAVVDFLSFGFVADPKTIWAAVRKLPPAHYLIVDLGPDGPALAKPVAYWDLEFDPDRSIGDWGPVIRSTLEHAADEMSFADVPVGTFLSGGVDSSSVTAALSRAGRSVKTFTVGFAEQEFDERPWAIDVARQYGTEHTERVVRPDDVASVFEDTILWHYDEPFNDYSYLPTYYVCREARKSITVALSGDGGDEMFGGYGKYTRLARRAALERALTPPVTQLVAAGARSILAADNAWRERLGHYEEAAPELLLGMLTTGMGGAALRGVARGPLAEAVSHYDPMDVVRPLLRKAPPERVGLVNSMRYLDLKLTLAGGILTKVDRASMAVSLEVRPVYLHRDLLELAGRIPPEQLADRSDAKKVLKAALTPWLSPSLLYRGKMGFAMPLGRWLRDGAAGFAEPGTGSSDALREIIDLDYVRRATQAHRAGASDRTAQVHSFLFLERWLEKWS
jgi:asparagine synthase (glutamine-hydrolysing)